MRILREPALLTGLVAGVIQLGLSVIFPGWTVEQQGLANALVVAVFGLIAASLVSTEKAAAAVTGVVKAAIALALAFGLHLAPSVQSGIMVLVSALGAAWLRTQVTAKVADASPGVSVRF